MAKVRSGDTITMRHPNGDRIGPRKVTAVSQAGGATSLLVENLGDFDPSSAQARYGRYLGTLEEAGWVVESINGTPLNDQLRSR